MVTPSCLTPSLPSPRSSHAGLTQARSVPFALAVLECAPTENHQLPVFLLHGVPFTTCGGLNTDPKGTQVLILGICVSLDDRAFAGVVKVRTMMVPDCPGSPHGAEAGRQAAWLKQNASCCLAGGQGAQGSTGLCLRHCEAGQPPPEPRDSGPLAPQTVRGELCIALRHRDACVLTTAATGHEDTT